MRRSVGADTLEADSRTHKMLKVRAEGPGSTAGGLGAASLTLTSPCLLLTPQRDEGDREPSSEG